MYFNCLNLGFETFPILTVFILFYKIVGSFYHNNKVIKYRDEKVLFIFILFIIAYFFIFFIFLGFSNFFQLVKYLIGPLCYVFFDDFLDDVDYKIVRNVIYLIFILTLLSIVSFKPLIILLNFFIPRNSFGYGIRGISVLTPEPSYYAFFAILFYVFVEYIVMQKKCSKKQAVILHIVNSCLCLISLSFLCFLILIIFWGNKFYHHNKFLFIMLIGIGIFGIIFYFSNITNNRIGQVFNSFFRLFSKDIDIFTFLFYVEPSGSTRIIVNFLAIMNVFQHPFGTGLGTFNNHYKNTAQIFNVPIGSHEVLQRNADKICYAQTYFCNIFNDIGIFAIIFIVFLMTNNNKFLSIRFKRLVVIYILFMTFFQCQITNPIYWIIILFIKKRRGNMQLIEGEICERKRA